MIVLKILCEDSLPVTGNLSLVSREIKGTMYCVLNLFDY